MKRVSFEVAKAIKEAGYPQSNMRNTFFNKQGELLVVTNINDRIEYDIYAPTYLEVWLWLWKEKKIYIDITHYYSSNEATIWDNEYNKIKTIDGFNKCIDPEETIIIAINYLVDKNLIK